MPNNKVVAWEVVSPDGEAVIVFAKTWMEANKQGKDTFGCKEVESSRKPEYDKYSDTPGGVPIEVLMLDGYWFDCATEKCINPATQVIGEEAYCQDCATELLSPKKPNLWSRVTSLFKRRDSR